jgi:hypothetical protein
MQSVKLSQMSAMQRNAVMDYMAAHRDFSTQEPIVHFSSCSVDITFPDDFFAVLRDREVTMARDARKLREKEALKKLPPPPPIAAETAAVPPPKSLSWLLRTIDDVYSYRAKQLVLEEHTKAFRGPPRCTVDDLAVHAFEFLSKRFGVPDIVRRTSLELLAVVKFHRELDHDTQLFSVLLSSGAYDTADVRLLLDWRSIVLPFAHVKSDMVHPACPQLGHVQRRYVRVCEIPSLVRKCVAASKLSASFFNRCRDAYPKWCDDELRFPAVVPDPNFYCPPFHPRSPYLGANCHSALLTVHEAKFFPVPESSVVPMAQVLLLLLLNAKAERLDLGTVVKEARIKKINESPLLVASELPKPAAPSDDSDIHYLSLGGAVAPWSSGSFRDPAQMTEMGRIKLEDNDSDLKRRLSKFRF